MREDVQKDFNVDAQARLATTVPARADCFTYFKVANGKITTNWPGYATEYRLRTHKVSPVDFEFAKAG